MKFIVICGPVLIPHDSQVLDVLRESAKTLGPPELVVDYVILPEATMGAEQVRNLMGQLIAGVNAAIVVTRYEHAVSEFANAVADGTITREDVVFKLVQYEDGDMSKFSVTDHKMDETNSFLGDDWPMWILIVFAIILLCCLAISQLLSFLGQSTPWENN